MRAHQSQESAPSTDKSSAETHGHDPSPLSLSRLRQAFAAMLSPHGEQQPIEETSADGKPVAGYNVNTDHRRQPLSKEPSAEINTRSVVEAMLFVGRPDNKPFSARELAAAMRGVSPSEIDTAVSELNAFYDAEAAPYRIVGGHAGYSLELRAEFERMRDKFYGRVREAKLSPAVVEVLSIVAYNQPATVDEVNELRGAPSGAALSTLVRRRLLRLERGGEDGGTPRYSTTDRFLRLFGLDNLSALPRSEELEKA